MLLRSGRLIVALTVSLLAVALASCTSQKAPPAAGPTDAWGPPRSGSVATASPAGSVSFVGNEACQPCHAEISAHHSSSRHMKTLLSGTKEDLAEFAPPAGQIAGLGTLVWDKNRAVIQVPNKNTGAPVSVPIDLVLGSGKTGMTYMGVHDEGSVEIRQSWFPHEKKWFFTPGMEKYDPSVVAASLTVPETSKCIACHSVTVPNAPLIPERKFFGVGCESCHGPAGKHVEAMTGGASKSSGTIDSLKNADGYRLNELCGKCHQTEKSVTEDNLNRSSTGRFQPYGLAKSKCFNASNGALSCKSCHNPHTDASTDLRAYEKVCLTCHTAPKTVCPVNPKSDCTHCHMPTRTAFANAQFSVKMADHFIRIWKPDELKAALSEAK